MLRRIEQRVPQTASVVLLVVPVVALVIRSRLLAPASPAKVV